MINMVEVVSTLKKRHAGYIAISHKPYLVSSDKMLSTALRPMCLLYFLWSRRGDRDFIKALGLYYADFPFTKYSVLFMRYSRKLIFWVHFKLCPA